LTADGWTGERIAESRSVSVCSIRNWRSSFRKTPVAGVRRRHRTGRPPTIAAAALPLAQAIIAEAPIFPWTMPRLRAEIVVRGGPAISPSHLSDDDFVERIERGVYT
jgi:transposase